MFRFLRGPISCQISLHFYSCPIHHGRSGISKVVRIFKGEWGKKFKTCSHYLFSHYWTSFLLLSVLGHREVENFLKLEGIDFPDFNLLSVNLHHAQRFPSILLFSPSAESRSRGEVEGLGKGSVSCVFGRRPLRKHGFLRKRKKNKGLFQKN